MIERPVFLVGAERSGTTVLRLMLDHHPRIAFSSEFEYAVDLVPEAEGWPDLEGFGHHLARSRVFRDHGYRIDPSLSYPELVDDFLRQKRGRDGATHVGATVHRNFDRLGRIWPDARYVHIVRDPRDVARSCIGMGWAGNVWTGSAEWVRIERLWDRIREGLGPDRFVEVRSEDLMHDPPSSLARVCSLFGLEYDPAMLSYSEDSTYGPPDPSLCYQWRRKLSEREIRLVEARVGPLLTDRGFEPSGLPPLEVSTAMELALRLQDKRSRIGHRLRTLGPRLYAEDVVARRVGSRSWRDRVRSRINEVERALLK